MEASAHWNYLVLDECGPSNESESPQQEAHPFVKISPVLVCRCSLLEFGM
jgi:hypothetical protein